MKRCELCPRLCRVERSRGRGYCEASEEMEVALVSLHKWEEPCLVGEHGAGTIFFSRCNLRCAYCQNDAISHGGFGASVTIERLAEIFLEQQRRGAANVELVTPTHYTEQICAAIDEARRRGLTLPIVWNSNAYERPETLELLRGRVDVFLPDLKYCDDVAARTFSDAPNYFAIAQAAIQKMFELVGTAQVEGGLMRRGVLVRHLVLPNHRRDAMRIIDWLWATFGDAIYISLMNQYTPVARAGDYKEISRPLTTFEYRSVVEHAAELGVVNCFVQTGKTASTRFIPNFNLAGVNRPNRP